MMPTSSDPLESSQLSQPLQRQQQLPLPLQRQKISQILQPHPQPQQSSARQTQQNQQFNQMLENNNRQQEDHLNMNSLKGIESIINTLKNEIHDDEMNNELIINNNDSNPSDMTVNDQDIKDLINDNENNDEHGLSNLLDFDSEQLIHLNSEDQDMLNFNSEDLQISNLSIS